MTRVALYARYSSDNQSAASIEDQLRLCDEMAVREGWSVVQTYRDAAISGASMILRPGIQAVLEDARNGAFDVLLAEALDRISRDQADVATLFKHLRFSGVRIITLAEGEISELHVGLKGTMNALFLKDLAMKTHRGLRGRVEKGRSGGGLCYGYDVVKRLDTNGDPVTGERSINEPEAEIVRRIFREFASGKGPKSIARDLNADGIAGPLGRSWGGTTIRGHVSRGTGIINNELYAGVLVWNRLRYIKDPNTGKRVSRVNPEGQWIRTEVPHLRIVPDDLWQGVKIQQDRIARQMAAREAANDDGKAHARRIHAGKRPASLLSGLMTCGVCGGKVGIIVNSRFGCLNHHRGMLCANNRTIRKDVIEARVLSGLTERMASPDAVAKAVKAYHEENNRLNQARRAQVQADRKALDRIDRSIRGIITAIEDGMYQPAMKARMQELERQKAEIAARMTEVPADLPDVNPNVSELYRAKAARLVEAVNDPEGGREVVQAIRALIGSVVLTPGPNRGEVHASLRGELVAILDLANGSAVHRARGGNGAKAEYSALMTKAVASPRNQA